jgi:hypothetical protein
MMKNAYRIHTRTVSHTHIKMEIYNVYSTYAQTKMDSHTNEMVFIYADETALTHTNEMVANEWL